MSRPCETYGPLKAFRAGKVTVWTRTKDEAAQRAGVSRSEVVGPRYTDALRGEPAGIGKRHPDVLYLGIRTAVRRLQCAGARAR